MISAIVPATNPVFAVFAGPKGEVLFSRVQCWAVTDIIAKDGHQMVVVGRQVTGIALRDGQLAPCNGVNITNFVGYDESRAWDQWVVCDVQCRPSGESDRQPSPGFAVPDATPWVEKCRERRKVIEEERAKAMNSKIVLPGGGSGIDPAWNAAKDLKALRDPERPI